MGEKRQTGGKMIQKKATPTARDIMERFAESTGLMSPDIPPRRYLWTDAFAVCNFLALYGQTSEQRYRDLALRLVDQVHQVLGKHREDDPRTGWISGLDEAEGKRHPTRGGLRIGKKRPERGRTEPFDNRAEWDRDGQYFHYLTKWMHALDQVSRATGDADYNRWARELAEAVHEWFTYAPPSGGPKRMHWKMSIDLSYPLVPSMGHHDPLDGFITYQQLEAAKASDAEGPNLHTEIADMADLCRGRDWTTDDPLGLGGLLSDAYRLAQLIVGGHLKGTDLFEDLLTASSRGLGAYSGSGHLNLPADYRLAFRELGLSIGLQGARKLKELVERRPDPFNAEHPVHSKIGPLTRHAPFIQKIESFWLDPDHRKADSWTAHEDINGVMLATSLTPGGYLEI